ncbi:MAG: helix-turn-helix domain-containing protein [Alphaproteobacteria bacterium]|nr:helix-turn-helix domain-containing protein [Alphaproteobacteria bacterium]
MESAMATKQKLSRHDREKATATFIASAAKAPHRLTIVVYPGLSGFDAICAAELLSTANNQVRRDGVDSHDIYAVEVIAPTAGPITLEMGIKIVPDRSIHDPGQPIDTLVISGGNKEPIDQARGDAAFMAWLRGAASSAKRVVSMCTGAFLLADAGLARTGLTTHWAHCERMRDCFPDLEVHSDRIFVKEGNVYSAAGGTAAMDLVLALIEEDLGRKLAMNVARRMVMFLKRPGGQAQVSATLLAQSADSDALRGVPEWIVENLDEDLSVEALAHRASMSPRNFARVFTAETGLTPAKYVERARLEQARVMIEQTQLPLGAVAHKAGFESEQQMRRAFTRWLRVTPAAYVERFRISSFDGGLVVGNRGRRGQRTEEQPWLP